MIRKNKLMMIVAILLATAVLPVNLYAQKTVVELPPVAGSTLKDGVIYTVPRPMTINAAAGQNALNVEKGATVTIYLPLAASLTVRGGSGDYATPGGAGINVPAGSTLIVTGQGELIAVGGRMGYGSPGSNGLGGYLSIPDDNGRGGQGGTGGAGGGGAGAAIGTGGGAGHSAQAGPIPGLYPCEGDSFDGNGATGYDSKDGSSSAAMGDVYILGEVKVTTSVASAGYSYASAGAYVGNSATDAGSGWHNNYTSGGGGPGGGGGSGYYPKYSIGSGGSGGQCGATGGSGGTMKNSSGRTYLHGGGGEGGFGYFSGMCSSLQAVSGSGKIGGSGGKSVVRRVTDGDQGKVYKSAEAKITFSNYKRDDVSVTTKYPDAIKVVYSLMSNGKTVSQDFYYGEPYTSVAIPERPDNNMSFEGYFTSPEGGVKLFDHNGNPTRQICNEAGQPTLYAHWIKDVWTITCGKDLKDFIEAIAQGHNLINAVVANDFDAGDVTIKINGSWYDHPYMGTFDGKFHTISNIHMSFSQVVQTGLFQKIGEKGVVKNLMINGVVYETIQHNDVSVIAGGNAGTIQSCGTLGSLQYLKYNNLYPIRAGIAKYQDPTGRMYDCVTTLENSVSGTCVNCYSSADIGKLAPGEIAYKLNHGNGLPFRQTIGVDRIPVFGAGHEKVTYNKQTDTYHNMSYLLLTDGAFVNTYYYPNQRTSVIAHLGYGPVDSDAFSSTFFGAKDTGNASFSFVLDKQGNVFKAKGVYSAEDNKSEETIEIDSVFDSYSTYDRYIGMSRQELYVDSLLTVPEHNYYIKGTRKNFNCRSKVPLYIGSADEATHSTPLYVHEFMIMEGGVLLHHFLPSKFDGNVGLYDVVAHMFCPVAGGTGAKLNIPYCDHRYTVKELIEGVEYNHCCICDNLESESNFRLIHYKSNAPEGQRADGMMGDELFIAPSMKPYTAQLRTNSYNIPMYSFEHWNTEPDGSGISYVDHSMLTISSESKGSMTLYAQWIPCYTFNGDTIKIPSDSIVEEVSIVDDQDNTNGFATAEPITVKQFDYVRTLPEGCNWGSLCLPVQLVSDAKVQYYLTGDVNGDLITLHPAETVPAGRPCVFLITDESNVLHLSADTVYFDGKIDNTAPDNGNIHLYGTYEYQDFKCSGDEPYYAIQDSRFYNVSSSMVVRPFRAYFRLREVPHDVRSRISITNELEREEALGLDAIDPDDVRVIGVFDLNGVSLKGLRKGINIIRYNDGTAKKIYLK